MAYRACTGGRAPIGSRGVNGDAVGSHSTGHVGTGLGVRDHQRGGATEARGTLVIRNIFDLGEQQRIIGLVVAVSTRPAEQTECPERYPSHRR